MRLRTRSASATFVTLLALMMIASLPMEASARRPRNMRVSPHRRPFPLYGLLEDFFGQEIEKKWRHPPGAAEMQPAAKAVDARCRRVAAGCQGSRCAVSARRRRGDGARDAWCRRYGARDALEMQPAPTHRHPGVGALGAW